MKRLYFQRLKVKLPLQVGLNLEVRKLPPKKKPLPEKKVLRPQQEKKDEESSLRELTRSLNEEEKTKPGKTKNPVQPSGYVRGPNKA